MHTSVIPTRSPPNPELLQKAFQIPQLLSLSPLLLPSQRVPRAPVLMSRGKDLGARLGREGGVCGKGVPVM